LRHRILYQEQIRVPLIARFPGGPEGERIDALVRTVDVYPTILDWVGIDPPAEVEGKSLRPLIERGNDPPRIAYADQLNLFDLNAAMVKRRPDDDLLHCAMDRSWKLIYRPNHPEKSELYHLAEDPGETENLFHVEKAEVARLRAYLDRLGAFVDEPFGEGVDPLVEERLRALGYIEE